jgi:arylsulfatase A-like enzyme
MRKLGAGVAGGILAGALVGTIEALVVWHRGAGGLPPIGWAMLAYGLVGGLGGAGAGVLAIMLGTDGFALGLGGVAATLGFWVARTRVLHDVLLDRPLHGGAPVVVQMGAAVAAAVIAMAVWRVLRGAEARHGVLTRPGMVLAVVAIAGIAGTIASRSSTPAGAPAAAPTAIAAPPGAPNVVLIVVDSLRADHLSSYGYGQKTSPRIDALAAEGTRYAHAFAQASSTHASMATILSGLVPTAHGVVRAGDRLPDGVETLAEVLARAGYHTAGFANDAAVAGGLGFGQGFAEYRLLQRALGFGADAAAGELAVYDVLLGARERLGAIDKSLHHRPAEYVVEQARAWLDGAAAVHAPFFLFVHLMDPHEPYVLHPADGSGYGRRSMRAPAPAMVGEITRAYDGEIAHVDAQVGMLVDELRRRGLYDGTLIVLTADHGEELVDHGGWWHGTTLYDEQIAVPLIVKPPHGGTGRVADALVTSLDVAPTILAAAGLTPPPAMRGLTLPMRGGAVPARDSVFAEETTPDGTVLRAVRTRAWKLVTASPVNARGLPALELFAIADDPEETRNLAAEHPREREEMRAALGRTVLAARAQVGRAAEPDVDAATKARLKQLGYL